MVSVLALIPPSSLLSAFITRDSATEILALFIKFLSTDTLIEGNKNLQERFYFKFFFLFIKTVQTFYFKWHSLFVHTHFIIIVLFLPSYKVSGMLATIHEVIIGPLFT